VLTGPAAPPDRSRPFRALRAVLCALLAAAVLAGCGGVPVSPPPPSSTPGGKPRPVPAPTDCTQTLAGPQDAAPALAAAAPGDKLCLIGRYPPDTALTVQRSGTAAQPIVLESDGLVVDSIEVTGDNVVVQGFSTRGTGGIRAQGNGVIIRNNDVRGAVDSGISCLSCTNARVIGNWVQRMDGVGIVMSGSGGVIRDNEVSNLVRRSAADADGIGFTGSQMSVIHNFVHDIPVAGYPPGQAPHGDCFRTADQAGQPSAGVSLTGNVCAGVGGRCLTADGTQRGAAAAPAGSQALSFENNYCQSGTGYAVALFGYPGAQIEDNIFSAPYTTAVFAAEGSTGVAVTGNTLVGDFGPAQADATSATGLDQSGNRAR
jgi:hypothetical protein